MKKYILTFVLFALCLSVSAAEPETTESWKAIAGTVLTVFVGAFSALAIGLVNLILALISKKFNIQVDEAIKVKLEGAVETGIKAAEAWARNQTVKPTSSEKLNYALSMVKTVAGISIVKRFVDEDLVKLIESKLFTGVAAGGPVSKGLGFDVIIQSKGAFRG